MRTSQLIEALAADTASPSIRLRGRFLLALSLGTATSLGLFLTTIGLRPDTVAATGSLRFDLKFADTLTLALPSAILCWRLLRPNARAGALAAMYAAPVALLGAAVVAELLIVPRELWGAKWIGSNALNCLVFIPLLSAPILFALLYTMRDGAPKNPALTGAFAGAASAGIAAAIYASHCPDDSPLFVASWFPLATAIVAAFGALAGRRLLRW